MVRLLTSNVARNQLSNVSIYEGALAAQAGSVVINVVDGNEEYSSIWGEGIRHGGLVDRASSPDRGRFRDDRLGWSTRAQLEPSFIKVDTEGAECMVFRGALDVLRLTSADSSSTELADQLLASCGGSAVELCRLL